MPIVGVVADFQTGSMRDAIRPAILTHSPDAERMLGIRLKSKGRGPASVSATLAAMQTLYKKIYPQGEFDARFMDESIAQLYADEQQTASLVRAAMTLAIFISCMGLFGLALFTTERKAREIGIRKVLGATVTNIVTMITKDFALLVLLALLIATPFAWWFAHRWLQDFAYRVPVHGWLFLLAGAGAILIALLTVGFQSIRAAMANPIKHLRSE
jgi:ABC-type antimicrobial peptide transport system permease subunit